MNKFGDEARAIWAKWVNLPSGLTPEMASKFKLGLHGGKTVRDMTTAEGPDYICSTNRFRQHCAAHPEWWGPEERQLASANTKAKIHNGNWNRAKTHCARGHDLAIHGKLTIQKGGWKWRRCTLCTIEYGKGSGTIRPEVVEKVKEALKSGVKIGTILTTIMRPPVYNLLRQRDPSINALIEETRPLREANRVRVSYGGPGSRGGVSHLPGARQSRPNYMRRASGIYTLREPTLTGIIAGRPDPLFDAVSAAVGIRMSRDIRMEAISLTTMDYLEGRIDMAGIQAAAKKHVSALHSQQRYTRSLDEPRYSEGSTPWIETIPSSSGLWS